MARTNEELWNRAIEQVMLDFDKVSLALQSISNDSNPQANLYPSSPGDHLALIRRKVRLSMIYMDMKTAQESGADYLAWKLSYTG